MLKRFTTKALTSKVMTEKNILNRFLLFTNFFCVLTRKYITKYKVFAFYCF